MMQVFPLPLEGAAEIVTLPVNDERGWFARLFCQKELEAFNNGRQIQQINCSFTKRMGTIRGLHFQRPPFAEDKAVRCIAGRIYDVMVDLRADSPTMGRWHSVVLDATKMNMVYIPRGFAHGFQTLTEHCQVLYLHTEFRAPEHEAGFSYASPALDIAWPLEVSELSTRDQRLPLFDPSLGGMRF